MRSLILALVLSFSQAAHAEPLPEVLNLSSSEPHLIFSVTRSGGGLWNDEAVVFLEEPGNLFISVTFPWLPALAAADVPSVIFDNDFRDGVVVNEFTGSVNLVFRWEALSAKEGGHSLGISGGTNNSSYAVDLLWKEPIVSTIPEPRTDALLVVGVIALSCVRRSFRLRRSQLSPA